MTTTSLQGAMPREQRERSGGDLCVPKTSSGNNFNFARSNSLF
jgi:hypothetical protein